MAADALDLFVSYTSADRPWAEWIAWELEAAGFSVLIQAWDIRPGANFVLAMDQAARVAERTVAVLSPAFLESPYCAAEWASAFREDPKGERRLLVPVRVRECDPTGLLGQVAYVDVVGLSEVGARDALLTGLTAGRAKPALAPAFPGERVPRPHGGAAIFNVPVTTRTFVGRQRALKILGDRFAGAVVGTGLGTQAQAIHGIAGVGKTQLAARYARAHRDEYDVVWWLRTEQLEMLNRDLAGLGVALGLSDEADADEPAAVLSAHKWLERNGRWLLIMDNAEGPDAIADVLPEGAGGHVLITSRAQADWLELHVTPLPLGVWTRAESLAFLSSRTGEQDTAILDELAAVLGDLPRALEQAARAASREAFPLATYTRRLREHALELIERERPPDTVDPSHRDAPSTQVLSKRKGAAKKDREDDERGEEQADSQLAAAIARAEEAERDRDAATAAAMQATEGEREALARAERADRQRAATIARTARSRWAPACALVGVAAVIGLNKYFVSGPIHPAAKPCTQPALAAGAGGRTHQLAGVITRVGSNGCTVGASEMAEGAVANVPAGHQVWLLVQSGGFFPQNNPPPIARDGSWTAPVYFGLGRFVVLLVVVGPQGQKLFRRSLNVGNTTHHFVGIASEDLPQDLVILASISGLVRSD